MQRSLVAFLNHGVLPFVGRNAELERIRSFWNATSEAPGLRTLLLVGEAGIGKSRLIEESTRSIAASGGAVVNVKLYPDSATSLAPLLARALSRCSAAQHLLKSDPEENLPSVLAALARICGLRRTLLVVEDLHLLAGDALAEFAVLLDRLSDEPISFLASARPADVPARSVLERWLVDEIELAGLPSDAIGDICMSIFGERLDPQLIGILRDRTLGNAMALRSALRAGIKSGSFTVTTRGRVATPRVDQDAFVDELERNVRLLSEGMAAHLGEREREAARALASLGEVFAREAAERVIEGSSQMLELLTFKGIVHTSASSPAPLPGEVSAAPPFAFTHTLLHRHFIDQGNADPLAIIDIIASGTPLYSLLPFHLLLELRIPGDIPRETLLSAIDRTLRVTSTLDASPDWRQAPAIWRAAAAMADALRPQLSHAEGNDLEVRLLLRQLGLMRREQTEEYPRLVERLLALTEAPADAVWAEYRLRALVYHRRYLRNHDAAASRDVRTQVEEITAAFPSARFSPPYVSHLRESIRLAQSAGDIAEQRLVESRLMEILDAEEASEEIRRYAHQMISPYLVTLFASGEELAKRLATIDELEATLPRMEPELMMWKIGLYYMIGNLREALEAIESAMEMFVERGLAREVTSSRLIALFARRLLGESPEELIELIGEAYRSVPAVLKEAIDAVAASHFATAGLLLNDLPWTARILEMLPRGSQGLAPAPAILLALRNGRIDELPESVTVSEPHDVVIRDMLAAARDASFDVNVALASASEFLSRPILRLDEALAIFVTLDLLDFIRSRDNAQVLREESRVAVGRLIEWLAARLPLAAARALDTYGDYFTRAELKVWRARLEPLLEGSTPQPSADRKLHVSMLGTITVQPPGGEVTRVRGGQLCTLLGLMVADRLLRDPLSQSEFTAIAMGTERDPESVRKSMNFAVFRLRELLGGEAISTEGSTPALDFNLVEVDLVEANDRLRAASEAMRDGALLRAVPEIMAALETSAGKVPFPTLYDEFFEAAREDFETELRAVTLRVARALAREGDHVTAERVLGRAFAAMPDDEELAELLQESLVALGQRTEARRVGMRAAEIFE